MKTIKLLKVLFFLGSGFAFLSCESFTEVSMPEAQLTSAAVFADVSTANAALSDIYSRMRNSGVASGGQIGLTYLLANYSDDLQFFGTNANFEQFNRHTLIASNIYISNIWTLTYGDIYAVNALIEGVTASAAIKGLERDRLLGEAFFLRGYLHFYLLNLYNEVPYVTTKDYKVNRAASKLSRTETYERILADLLEAEVLLPNDYVSSDRVRPNRGVVNAMLARLYLYTEAWEKCEEKASEVIADPRYSWESNLAGVFLKDSPAIIWALHPGISGQNTIDARTFAFSSGPPSKPALSPELYQSFETGDLRKSLWIRTIGNGPVRWYHAFKYKRNGATSASEEYTILFRLAEQFLIRAEARAQLANFSGANSDLNKVRARAGLADLQIENKEPLLTAILKERRAELFTEQGHRWFDLKRTGNASAALSAIKPGWSENSVWWPIPENELLLNGNLLPQNAGY